jgi:hypothetical protein
MSFKESQFQKFYFSNNEKKLITPENPFTEQLEKQRLEKEAEEAKQLLFELEVEKQKEIDAKLDSLEMVPLLNKVILLPYPTNPYRKLVQGKLIVDYTGDFLNPDSGEKDTLKELVGCAKVIEIGPEVKYIKPGDDVYYDTRTVYPIPFMSLGYRLTTEPQILCILNQGLKDRLDKIKTNLK